MTFKELWELLVGRAGEHGILSTGCAFLCLVLAIGCGFILSLIPAGWVVAAPMLDLGPAPFPTDNAGFVLALAPLFLFLALVLTLAMIIDAETKK